MVDTNLSPSTSENTPLEELNKYREFLIDYPVQDYVDEEDFRQYMELLQKALEDFDARLTALEQQNKESG